MKKLGLMLLAMVVSVGCLAGSVKIVNNGLKESFSIAYNSEHSTFRPPARCVWNDDYGQWFDPNHPPSGSEVITCEGGAQSFDAMAIAALPYSLGAPVDLVRLSIIKLDGKFAPTSCLDLVQGKKIPVGSNIAIKLSPTGCEVVQSII